MADNFDRYKHPLKGIPDKCGQIYCEICKCYMTVRDKEWFGD